MTKYVLLRYHYPGKKKRKFKRVFSLCENGQRNGSVFWDLKRFKTFFVFFFKKFQQSRTYIETEIKYIKKTFLIHSFISWI
jgi:hypothetical protein